MKMRMSVRMSMNVSSSVYEYEYGTPYRVSTKAVFLTGNLEYLRILPYAQKGTYVLKLDK